MGLTTALPDGTRSTVTNDIHTSPEDEIGLEALDARISSAQREIMEEELMAEVSAFLFISTTNDTC